MTVMCAVHHIPINNCPNCSADEQFERAQASRAKAPMTNNTDELLALGKGITEGLVARLRDGDDLHSRIEAAARIEQDAVTIAELELQIMGEAVLHATIAELRAEVARRDAAITFALDELKYMPAALAQWAGGMGKTVTNVRKRLLAALKPTSNERDG